MTTTFSYLNKEYQVEIDPEEWYKTDSEVNTIIKLPNGELLAISNWTASNVQPQLVPADHLHLVLEATEVDKKELAFQSLLKQYNLTDNPKTKKLWNKCCALSGYNGEFTQVVLEKINNYWEGLVDLIQED